MSIKLNDLKLGLNGQQKADIKNIVFDFGGVIIDVHFEKAIESFKNLGFTDFDNIFTQMKQTSLFDLFETGKIPAQTFRNELRKFKNHLSDEQIDAAWNSMIGELPRANVELLHNLRKNYRTFLLSNTNMIHMDFVFEYFKHSFGQNPFEEMFEQIYLSYEIGLRKPDKESYQHVLMNAGLKAEETIFIDDLFVNIEGARNVGMQSFHLKSGLLTDLFENVE